MIRAEILEAARRRVCGEREGEYGTPERNFDTIARLWTAYLNARVPDNGFRGTLLVTPKDVAMMMALLKVARISTSDKADSFVDLAGYAACGGEIAIREEGTDDE